VPYDSTVFYEDGEERVVGNASACRSLGDHRAASLVWLEGSGACLGSMRIAGRWDRAASWRSQWSRGARTNADQIPGVHQREKKQVSCRVLYSVSLVQGVIAEWSWRSAMLASMVETHREAAWSVGALGVQADMAATDSG
jgi:hypothetical protein